MTPPPDVVASLRHAEPVEAVPDELVAFVAPVHVDGRLDDWRLTSDAVAFGDVTVPQAFEAWRSSWERSWTIESHRSLVRLADRCVELKTAGSSVIAGLLRPMIDTIDRGDAVELSPGEVMELTTAVTGVRDHIAAMGISGIGFVDATPGAATTGLARAWSAASGSEILAADDRLTVRMHPSDGLVVEHAGRRTARIREVVVHGDRVEVRHDDPAGAGTFDLVPELARPLSWIVPQATQWRCVAVPEVLVWARTFGALVECSEAALMLDCPVRFASHASLTHEA